MNRLTVFHHRHPPDSRGLLPTNNRVTAILHTLMLAGIVFLAGMSAARADMVFDFQMKLAEKGNPEAMYKIGEMYDTGRGVEKNQAEAMKWIQKAADLGHEPARYKLLYEDVEKNGVNAGNKEQLENLKAKAGGDDGYAQYYMGMMLSRGVGMQQNEKQAMEWLNKASLVGITAAETEITHLRESQVALARQREAEQQKRLEMEAAKKREAERKAQEAQAAAEAERKRRAAEEAAAAKRKSEQQKLAESRAAKEAEEARKAAALKAAEDERRRAAILAERKQKEAEKKAQFESDPCSGKSARFLSTCR